MTRIVVSASRRTDIPAFFSQWFMQRVRSGFVMVRNPRNPQHIQRVSLLPSDVAAVVFWSRNYQPLLGHLDEIDGCGLRPIFHLTLTDYGPPLELRGPQACQVIDQFERICARYGRDRITWRYDPIITSSQRDIAYHERRFGLLARSIAPLSSRCIISFLDLYPSTKRGLAGVEQQRADRFDAPVLATRSAIADCLVRIGGEHGLHVSACCEPDLTGVDRARCIDPDVIRMVSGQPELVLKDAPTRKGCGCVLARDIGAYHTCGHGCVYCYANESEQVGLSRSRQVQINANHLGEGDLEESAPAKRQLSLLDHANRGSRAARTKSGP